MTRELDGRIVLITGGSRGIGAAVAADAAAAGATVLICGRDVPALERVADAIEASGGVAPVIVPLNLEGATAADHAQVAAHIESRFGRLDGLVVNAAALGELAPLTSYDPVTWARVFQVNVHSVFLMLQACMPLLARSASASIVFTLAEEGMTAKANWGAYAVSKRALQAMMEVLAAECAGHPALRVNGVLPPPLRTRLRLTAFPAADPRSLPLPDTVTEPYLRLLGPRGAGVHGHVITAGAPHP